MLRLETKQTGIATIKNIGSGLVNRGVYSNKIREVLSYNTTGHYMSLVSAYSPLSVFDSIGAFNITDIVADQTLFEFEGSVKNIADLFSHCISPDIEVGITNDKYFCFKLSQELTALNHSVYLNLSPSAAWALGFKTTKQLFPRNLPQGAQSTLYGDIQYPPITIKYLQIICKNVCGTSDSNITMPSCIGIMHITNDFSLINPHIAVNHRINNGRVIDIEILDQDNQPFTAAPVYLELFISEAAEHEKKQGFFRFEKPHTVHLHAPIAKLSVPDFFFLEPTFTFEYGKKAYIKAIGDKGVKKLDPHKDPYLISLRGKAITKDSMINIFKYINNYFIKVIGPNPDGPYITAEVDGDYLVLMTAASLVTITSDFITAWQKTDGNYSILLYGIISPTVRIRIPPYVWYNKDSRINLYCKEYHERYPIVSARRIHDRYQVINPLFWSWCELEKPTNELHFRADQIITYPDGSSDIRPFADKLEGDWAPAFQLFYK